MRGKDTITCLSKVWSPLASRIAAVLLSNTILPKDFPSFGVLTMVLENPKAAQLS